MRMIDDKLRFRLLNKCWSLMGDCTATDYKQFATKRVTVKGKVDRGDWLVRTKGGVYVKGECEWNMDCALSTVHKNTVGNRKMKVCVIGG